MKRKGEWDAAVVRRNPFATNSGQRRMDIICNSPTSHSFPTALSILGLKYEFQGDCKSSFTVALLFLSFANEFHLIEEDSKQEQGTFDEITLLKVCQVAIIDSGRLLLDSEKISTRSSLTWLSSMSEYILWNVFSNASKSFNLEMQRVSLVNLEAATRRSSPYSICFHGSIDG